MRKAADLLEEREEEIVDILLNDSGFTLAKAK